MNIVILIFMLMLIVISSWLILSPIIERKDVRYEECQECHRAFVLYKEWFKNGGVCTSCKNKQKLANTKEDGNILE